MKTRQEIINALDDVCTFDMCNNADPEPVDMGTCPVCWLRYDLKKELEEQEAQNQSLTFGEFIKRHQIKFKTEQIPYRSVGDRDEWDRDASHWLIFLEYDGRKCWFEYSQGSGFNYEHGVDRKGRPLARPPQMEAVFDCLASDLNMPTTLMGFIEEFGVDFAKQMEPLRFIEIVDEQRRQTEKIAKLLGRQAAADLHRVEW